MALLKKTAQEIEQETITGIALLIGEFSELFTARMLGCDTGALDAIESDWTDLQRKTEKIYQKMVSELTDTVDERDIIAKKKQSGTSRESN